MITQPDLKVLQSLARLAYNDDFNTMKEWLESEYKSLSNANDEQLNEVLLRRGQGAALLLRQLLSIQSNAESVLNKIKR